MTYLAPPKITEAIKANFFDFFDEKIGIVSEIMELRDVLMTPLYHIFASNTLCDGGGTAEDRDTALSKAIGECLERYCLCACDHRFFVETTSNSLNNRYSCIDPKCVEIYTSNELEQLSFNQYDDSFKTLFCVAYNVVKKIYQYVPLPMVFLHSPFFNLYPQQLNIIQQTISTGAAFGMNFYQTALTGIYEVIERDAMMAFWLLGQQAPKIQLETLGLKQQKFTTDIKEKNDVDLYLFDISLNDIVFVVLSCLKSKNPLMPAIVFSAAAHHDLDSAIQKALEEVVSTFVLAEALLRKNPKVDTDLLNPENWNRLIASKNDHVQFWSFHEIFDLFGPQLDFIFKTRNIISRMDLIKKNKYFENNRYAFSSVVDLLAQSGYETLLVDISTSEISSLGFMSLKAIIPGYLPLYLGHRFSYSKPKRLFEIAKSIYRLNLSEISLNKTPHPFP